MFEDGTTPSWLDVLEMASHASRLEINTAMPGRVESYDGSTADITLLMPRTLRNDDGTKEVEELGMVFSVPIIMPRCSGVAIELPLTKGDRVMVHFCQRNIGQWQANGGKLADPGDESLHPLSGAVAYPGGYPDGEESGEYEEGSLVIAASLMKIGSSGASEPVVLGNQLKSWLETHTHPTSFGPTGTAIQAANLTSTLSTKLKVE